MMNHDIPSHKKALELARWGDTPVRFCAEPVYGWAVPEHPQLRDSLAQNFYFDNTS